MECDGFSSHSSIFHIPRDQGLGPFSLLVQVNLVTSIAYKISFSNYVLVYLGSECTKLQLTKRLLIIAVALFLVKMHNIMPIITFVTFHTPTTICFPQVNNYFTFNNTNHFINYMPSTQYIRNLDSIKFKL